MGELLSGNFEKKSDRGPLSPLREKSPARVAFGEPKFSPNGVVEYKRGVRPKEDAEVLDRVNLHVNPMEQTILKAFPNLKSIQVPDEIKLSLHNASNLDLVKFLHDSEMADWIESEESAFEFLAVIAEVRDRDLDIED